jgi:Peptidase M1 N-terminal domain
MKATFDATLVIDAADTAISNTPIACDTPGPGDGKHTLKFDTTPKMSTYLLAFLVGDFQCTSGKQDGVTIRVCSTPDKKVGLPELGRDDFDMSRAALDDVDLEHGFKVEALPSLRASPISPCIFSAEGKYSPAVMAPS